mgnify:CR=1 FL=1
MPEDWPGLPPPKGRPWAEKCSVVRVGMDPIKALAMVLIMNQLRQSQRHSGIRNLSSRLWERSVNVAALEHLAQLSTVPVIAAGGVATLADVQKLYPLTLTTSLAGAVSGRALYEGTLNLEEANAWIAAQ